MSYILNILLKSEYDGRENEILDGEHLLKYFIEYVKITECSMAILSLVKYLQGVSIIKNEKFACVCYYSDETVKLNLTNLKIQNIDSIVVKALNSIYKGQFLNFVIYSNDQVSVSSDIYIQLRNLTESQKSFLRDTSFPSLERLICSNLNYLVYGLTSVYREIVTIYGSIDPNIKSLNLLGFRNNCLKVFLLY
jgi:hypothetical protein